MQTKALILIYLLSLPFLSTAQVQDFTTIDAHARTVKYKYGQDISTLANALTAGATSEKEKIRAFFVWITDNIKYDIKTFENRKDLAAEKTMAMQQPTQVLKSKKAVCAGYSSLLIALCEAVNIKALEVTGITKNHKGKVSSTAHAWCLVQAKGEWGLIDPTWGAGVVDLDEGKYTEVFKEVYFFTPPVLLIENHYPTDPLFQLLPNPLTLEEFKLSTEAAKSALAKKATSAPRKGYAQVADSLNAFIALDSVQRDYNIGTRILDFDPGSNLGLYKLGKYHFDVAYQHMERFQLKMQPMQGSGKGVTKQWCDDALALLNEAKKHLTESSAIISRSTKSDNYSSSIQNLRRTVEASLRSLEKNIESMKNMRGRIK